MTNNDAESEPLVKESKKLSEESLSNKLLLLDLNILIFFATLCSSVQTVFYSRVVLEKNGTLIDAAMIQQVHPAGIALTGIGFGKYLPHIGYKRLLMLGVLLEGSSQIGFAFTGHIQNTAWFVATGIMIRIFSGVGNSAVATSILAIAAEVYKSNSGLVISILEAVRGLSYILGPMIGAGLYAIYEDIQLPIALPGAVYILSISRFAFCHDSNLHFKSGTQIHHMSKIFPHIRVILPVIVLLTVTSILGYFDVTLTTFMQNLGLSVLQTGWVSLLGALGYLISAPVIGYCNTNWPRSIACVMIFGCFGISLSVLCINFGRNFLYISIGIFFVGVFLSLATISAFSENLLYLRSQNLGLTHEEVSSAIAGVWTSATNLGLFLVPLFSTIVITKTNSYEACNLGIAGYLVLFSAISTFVYCYTSKKRISD